MGYIYMRTYLDFDKTVRALFKGVKLLKDDYMNGLGWDKNLNRS